MVAAAARDDGNREVGFVGERLMDPDVMVPFLQKVMPALCCGLDLVIFQTLSSRCNFFLLMLTMFPLLLIFLFAQIRPLCLRHTLIFAFMRRVMM